jgi:hypothetical protein
MHSQTEWTMMLRNVLDEHVTRYNLDDEDAILMEAYVMIMIPVIYPKTHCRVY